MVLVGNLVKRDNLEDQGVDGRITLKRTFKKLDQRAQTGLIWIRIETISGSCQYGHSGIPRMALEYKP
jgi:hypothetical protein